MDKASLLLVQKVRCVINDLAVSISPTPPTANSVDGGKSRCDRISRRLFLVIALASSLSFRKWHIFTVEGGSICRSMDSRALLRCIT